MFSKHISISSLSSMATKEGNKSHIHSILTWCAPSPVVSEAFLFGMAGCPLHLEGPLESFSWLNSGNCSFLGLQCYICIYIYIYVYKDYFQHRRTGEWVRIHSNLHEKGESLWGDAASWSTADFSVSVTVSIEDRSLIAFHGILAALMLGILYNWCIIITSKK